MTFAVHRLAPNYNGDPVCCCGWDPVSVKPRPESQAEAISAVQGHVYQWATVVCGQPVENPVEGQTKVYESDYAREGGPGPQNGTQGRLANPA